MAPDSTNISLERETEMKKVFTLLLVALFSVAAYGQSALTATTLSSAVANGSDRTIVIASATGWSASSSSVRYIAVIDREALEVSAISGTTVTVKRGVAGTEGVPHVSGSSVLFLDAKDALTKDPSGACTSTNQSVLPRPSLASGKLFDCVGGRWFEIGGPDGFYVEATFCGDLGSSATLYMSPIDGYGGGNFYKGALTANDLDYALSGTGCAAEDNSTEATADEVMFPSNDAYAVGMYCTVDSSGSNGVTFALRDDAAATSPSLAVTIATATTSGVSARKLAAKIAAGSAVAVSSVTTENLSANDGWCKVRFQVLPSAAAQ
jgi:hypothetical protein